MSKEKAVDYFDRHKGSNECHITSDGRVFHSLGTATGFANGLKDNKVTSYTRAEFESPKEDVVGNEDSTDDETKAQALEVLKTFDAETADYKEIKALVKGLGLEAQSLKQADLLEALEAFKKTINIEINE